MIPSAGIENIIIPSFGMGTYRLKGSQVTELVYQAITLGYRYFDSAEVYRNEKDVALGISRALKEGLVKRNEVFYSTKISPKNQGYEKCLKGIQTCLDQVKQDIEYIDLLLLHWPGSQNLKACNLKNRENRRGSLQAMKESLAWPGNPIKLIGVSNFTLQHLQDIDPDISIYCNQIELHPLLYSKKETQSMIEYCALKNIRIQAYSSLGEGNLLTNRDVCELAESIHVSPAQLLLGWALQKGWMVIPKASSVNRLNENLSSLAISATLSPKISTKLDKLSNIYGEVKYCWDPSEIS